MTTLLKNLKKFSLLIMAGKKLSKRRDLRERMLYWDTSLRNPERSRAFLELLVEHEGKIVDSDLKEEVEISAVMTGLYRPINNPVGYKDSYTRDEALTIMNASPQEHQHGGKRGYASRFSTHFFNSRQLGFIHEELGEKLIISKSGHKLINNEKDQIQQIYQNALARYQTTIPFTANKNRLTPFSLLLNLIKIYIKNNKYGIPLEELPIIMCWKNNDADKLYQFLQKFRIEYDSISSENKRKLKFKEELNDVTYKYCAKIYGDKYSGLDKNGKFKLAGTSTKGNTVLKDYPDVYFRYLRITGLLYTKKIKNKWHIVYDSENQETQETIDYIISNFSKIRDFENDIDYLNYASTFDNYFFKTVPIQKYSSDKDLQKWIDELGLELIKTSLLNLASKKNKPINHEVLKYIDRFLLLEWLLSLYTYAMCNKNLTEYKPNYTVHGDGQIKSHASGQRSGVSGADAIAFTDNEFFILEPTLLTGVTQYNKESFSNHEHLESEIEKNPNKTGYCLQISPEPHKRTIRYAKDRKNWDNLNMIPISIEGYINKIEEHGTLEIFK